MYVIIYADCKRRTKNKKYSFKKKKIKRTRGHNNRLEMHKIMKNFRRVKKNVKKTTTTISPSVQHLDTLFKSTYSVACANGMPMNVGLSVSVYISMPVPRR